MGLERKNFQEKVGEDSKLLLLDLVIVFEYGFAVAVTTLFERVDSGFEEGRTMFLCCVCNTIFIFGIKYFLKENVSEDERGKIKTIKLTSHNI